MVQPRSKTDRLDARLLAQLLRINQIPLAYVPSEEFQLLATARKLAEICWKRLKRWQQEQT